MNDCYYYFVCKPQDCPGHIIPGESCPDPVELQCENVRLKKQLADLEAEYKEEVISHDIEETDLKSQIETLKKKLCKSCAEAEHEVLTAKYEVERLKTQLSEVCRVAAEDVTKARKELADLKLQLGAEQFVNSQTEKTLYNQIDNLHLEKARLQVDIENLKYKLADIRDLAQ